MPAADIIHNAVKNALIKDGWTITADPYRIEYEEIDLFADLAAERPIAAERAGERIVVEVKSFVSRSLIQDLKIALGQYEIYLNFLELTAPERKLYLAISDQVHDDFFKLKAINVLVERLHLSLLVVNVPNEEVQRWIN
jgi:hypothetical protein